MHIFVIDTDSYSGNFNRELCAYVTGRYGECEVGIEEAMAFMADGHKPFRNVVDVADDHGCYRPCKTWETPGYFSNGYGGHFLDIPENYATALNHFKQAGLAEHQKYLNIYTNYLSNLPQGWTRRQVLSAIRGQNKSIKKIEETVEVVKNPAFLSVAIFFSSIPTERQKRLMVLRASNYENRYLKNIIGYRLLEHNIKQVYQEIW